MRSRLRGSFGFISFARYVLPAILSVSFLTALPAFAQSCPPALPATITLTSDLASSVASATLGFHAMIQNQSAELLSGQLAVDVVQKDSGVSVSRFIIPERVNVLALSGGKTDFAWTIPGGLQSGSYSVIATYVSGGARVADIFSGVLQPAATYDVTVTGSDMPQPSIISMRVNDATYTPHSDARISDPSAHVTATIQNGASGPYKGTFTWRLYAAEENIGDAPLDAKTEAVELHPGGTADVTYTLTDTSRDGYYLEGELSDGTNTSFTDVWLARTGAVFGGLQCGNAIGLSLAYDNLLSLIGIAFAVLLVGGAWTYFNRRAV